MIGTFIFTAVILILDHATLLLSSGNKDQAFIKTRNVGATR